MADVTLKIFENSFEPIMDNILNIVNSSYHMHRPGVSFKVLKKKKKLLEENLSNLKKQWNKTSALSKRLLAPCVLCYSLRHGSREATEFFLENLDKEAIEMALLIVFSDPLIIHYGGWETVQAIFYFDQLLTEKIIQASLPSFNYSMFYFLAEKGSLDSLKKCWELASDEQREEIKKTVLSKPLGSIHQPAFVSLCVFRKDRCFKFFLEQLTPEEKEQVVKDLLIPKKVTLADALSWRPNQSRSFEESSKLKTALKIIELEPEGFLGAYKKEIFKLATEFDNEALKSRFLEEIGEEIADEAIDFADMLNNPKLMPKFEVQKFDDALRVYFGYAFNKLQAIKGDDDAAAEKWKIIKDEFMQFINPSEETEIRLKNLQASLEAVLDVKKDTGIRVNRGHGGYFWKGVFTPGSRNPFDHRIARSTTELNAILLYKHLSAYIEETYPDQQEQQELNLDEKDHKRL